MAVTRWSGSDMEFGPDLGPMGLSGLRFFKSLSCHCSVGVALLGYSSIMRCMGQHLRAWWWRSSSPPEAIGRIGAGCGDLLISHLVLAESGGGVVTGESRALTRVMVGDGDVNALLPC
jgi:hypothetical protein